MWNLDVRDAYNQFCAWAGRRRINWHGVVAVLVVCALWLWWSRKDWPAEENRIGVKPSAQGTTNTTAAVPGAEGREPQVVHSAPEIEKIEAAAKKVEAAAQQIERTAVSIKELNFAPRRTTGYTDSHAALQMKYGWYVFCASVAYAVLIILSAEKAYAERLADRRLAFGAHVFVILAFGALGLDGPARQDDDFYAFAFLASLAIGIAIPHLLARGAPRKAAVRSSPDFAGKDEQQAA